MVKNFVGFSNEKKRREKTGGDGKKKLNAKVGLHVCIMHTFMFRRDFNKTLRNSSRPTGFIVCPILDQLFQYTLAFVGGCVFLLVPQTFI